MFSFSLNSFTRGPKLFFGMLTNVHKSEFNRSVSAQALHTEIKGKKDKVEDLQKTSDTCATSIKVCCCARLGSTHPLTWYHPKQWSPPLSCFQDYELQLASYSSGLETLLKIPIKRTMLQSPASVVRHEVRGPSAFNQFAVLTNTLKRCCLTWASHLFTHHCNRFKTNL